MAIAIFHWTPAEFMDATPHEFWSGYEVWLEMNKATED